MTLQTSPPRQVVKLHQHTTACGLGPDVLPTASLRALAQEQCRCSDLEPHPTPASSLKAPPQLPPLQSINS